MRSSFNEENITGPSATYWLWVVAEPFEGWTLPSVISSWMKAAVISLVSGVNTQPSATESCLVSVVYVCSCDGNRVSCWPSGEWRVCWRSLGVFIFCSACDPVLQFINMKGDEHLSRGTLLLKIWFGTISFTLLLLILLWCSLCELPKLLVFHQRVL